MAAEQAPRCPHCGPTTIEAHPRLPVDRCSNCKEHLRQEATAMPIPEYILNSQCPHGLLYQNCEEVECNNYLRDVEENGLVDNSAEAWEEDWNDSPQLGGMGEELRQLYDEREDEGHCLATFSEDPMRDTLYCGERGPHSRHTAWQGRNYYAWLDGDEGAGHDPMQ